MWLVQPLMSGGRRDKGEANIANSSDHSAYDPKQILVAYISLHRPDVVNTYRVWLRYELFRGNLTAAELDASEANLSDYTKARSNTKPHLMEYCAE
jgi:hypothetical protein